MDESSTRQSNDARRAGHEAAFPIRRLERAIESAKAAVHTDGFARIEAAFDDMELRAVESLLDPLFFGARRRFRLFRSDLSERGPDDAPIHPEFTRPSLASRQLRRSAVFARCREIASAILRKDAHYLFDHAIYKMPRTGRDIPWHQDQAYLGHTSVIRSLHFWIPMQDTDTASGSLRFVPGSHRKTLLPHVRAFEANGHVLRADGVEELEYIDVPLRKGDVSVHTNLTVHSSGPNVTDGIRKAWIIHFGDHSIWRKLLIQFSERMHVS